MKRRVALQTCTIDNYGACLQAYALKFSIDNFGFDCQVLNFNRYDNDQKLSLKRAIKLFVRKLITPPERKMKVNYYLILLEKAS